MPVSITANTSALYAQASLSRQNSAVTAGTLRMSSGQRVLSAADDPSSMAIGSALRIENAGIKSAILNATAGTSMLQIADGALGQVSELVTRLQTLALQASSGQYDDATRTLLDGEFQGLKSEIDRLAGATMFNEVKILQGSKDFDLALGATAVDGLKNVRFDQTLVNDSQSFRYSYDATTEMMTVSRTDGATTTSQSLNLTALLNGTSGAAANLQGNQTIEVGFSLIGLTLTLDSNFNRFADIETGVTAASLTNAAFTPAMSNVPNTVVSDLAVIGAYSMTTGALNLSVTGGQLDAVPGITYGAAADATVAFTGAPVDVYADVAGGGRVLLGTLQADAVTGDGAISIGVGKGLMTATDTGKVAPVHLTYKVGTGISAGIDTISVDVPAMTLVALDLATVDITTQANAEASISKLKDALTVLNQGRATVGAQQQRMESVARSLAVLSENNEAARSSLIDVDVSAEITDITTNSALMQASIAMLGRANAMPDMLLELLRNN